MAAAKVLLPEKPEKADKAEKKLFRAMDSLDEARRSFSGFSPLAERLRKDVRILSIGEFFGGTMAFNSRAFLGVCSMLRQSAADGKPPDLIVINGGAIPEVPARGSRANRRKMEFLLPGIEDADDACGLMRRPMKQLIDAARGTPVAYVLGEDDKANIEILIDRKIAESRKAEHLQARIEGLKEEAKDLDARIESMDEEKDSLVRELRNAKKSLKKRGDGRIESHIRKQAKEIRGIAKKRDELLQRRKRLESRISLFEDDLNNLGAVRRTNTEFLTPGETREMKESATKEYLDLLHRLFEGADVRILHENVSVFELGGLRVAVGHSMENTSNTAKKGALPTRADAQSKLRLYGLLPTVDLLMYSHHPGTKGWALPQSFASSHPLYVFQQGGLADPEGLFDAHNRGIKTPHTEALEKHPVDSGVTLITAKADGSMKFDMMGLSQLDQLARSTLAYEHNVLRSRVEDGLKEADEKPAPQSLLELPSRLQDRQLSAVMAQRDLQKVFMPPARRKIRELIAEIYSDHHIGIGNPWDARSNQEIMKAEIADSGEQGLPDIIIFGGDMVEGALGSKLNEWNARNFVDEEEFARHLAKMATTGPGLKQADIDRAMLEYFRRRAYAYNVPNVDQQVNLLLPLLEHAAKVVAKGGEAIFISGNHYNQTHRGEVFDEAIRMAAAVRMIGGFPENDPRIHIFYGGWIGSGQVTVKGIPMFGIHKAGRPSRDHVSGQMEQRTLQRREDAFLHVQGHHHDMTFGKTLSDAHVSAPSIAPIIPYVDQAALHGGLQGYTRLSLYVDQDGKHLESMGVLNRFLPQLEKYLPKIDPLYLDVFRKMVKKGAGS